MKIPPNPFGIITPTYVREQREMLAMNDYCPECGGELDTGYECKECHYDAQADIPELT